MTSHREALLAEYWARCEAGEALTPAQFVRQHPDDAGWLLPALDNLLATAALLPTGELPATLGGYRVEGRLGRGATGEVFAVVDGAGRRLALKRLQPHISAGERANRRLAREAAVLRELRHPNIVEVVDFVAGDGGDEPAFLVMARVDGRPLSAIVDAAHSVGRERAALVLPGAGSHWQRIAGLVATLAEAVAAAHRAGVLHRDLKPGNVLLRADGTPVIVDFGLAADETAATLTATGDVLGTPQYMAPEQARGELATPASDVYGLGAILYELTTLAPPRGGADPLQVLDAARRDPPPPPRARCPDVPRELDLIVRRAMAFRPGHRFAGATELAQALALVAAGGRPIGLTLGFSLRADEFWRLRRRPIIAVGAASLLASTAWFGIGLWQAARGERARAAMASAAECHLDGDADGLAAAAAALARSGEAALAAFYSGEPAVGDAFVAALAEGQQRMRDDPAAALAQLQGALRLRPDAAIASGWCGIAAARAERRDVAERELTAAARALPGCVRVRVELGRLLRQEGKAEAACDWLQQAVDLPRADEQTWHEFAKALLVAKQHARAETAIDAAIARCRDPRRRLAALRTKAALFDAMGRSQESLPILRTLVDEAPSAATWLSYGMVLDRLHRLREADLAYRAVLEFEPQHANALLALAYLHAGSNPECAECRQAFAADAGLVDPALVDDCATRLLRVQAGDFAHAEAAADCVRRVGGGERFAAALEEQLAQDLPAPALGRLLRAKRALRAE